MRARESEPSTPKKYSAMAQKLFQNIIEIIEQYCEMDTDNGSTVLQAAYT